MRRRSFIQLTGLASTAVAVMPCMTAQSKMGPLVGSNIYGWSQYYGRMGKDVWANIDEVLSALRDAGYDYLEGNVDSGNPENNLRFAERCRAKGLKPACLYTGARLHEADQVEKSVERLLAAASVCKEAGFSLIDCNPDPIGRAKTDAELGIQAHGLELLGRGLRELGVQFGVHNHTPEMVDRAKEFHSNFGKTHPRNVGFCFDVHWVYRGGIPPEKALALYGSRIVSLHIRQSRGGIWWEDLDAGDVDYSVIARYLREYRLTPMLTVELAIEKGTKINRDAVENHRRSREWVRRVFNA